MSHWHELVQNGTLLLTIQGDQLQSRSLHVPHRLGVGLAEAENDMVYAKVAHVPDNDFKVLEVVAHWATQGAPIVDDRVETAAEGMRAEGLCQVGHLPQAFLEAGLHSRLDVEIFGVDGEVEEVNGVAVQDAIWLLVCSDPLLVVLGPPADAHHALASSVVPGLHADGTDIAASLRLVRALSGSRGNVDETVLKALEVLAHESPRDIGAAGTGQDQRRIASSQLTVLFGDFHSKPPRPVAGIGRNVPHRRPSRTATAIARGIAAEAPAPPRGAASAVEAAVPLPASALGARAAPRAPARVRSATSL
mmetsp:Transcript_9420/g.17436  ORF Transcript_9420/g.17436 Transcript_9420/m.17436 type:complete len:306 (-) Transcript_9420:292-1209(-)